MLSSERAKDSEECVGKASTALLVEESWLEGSAGEEATGGHKTNDGAAAEQANSSSHGCVPQRPEAHEGADDEVAMSHADLDAALPWLETLSVEGSVLDEHLAEAAVSQRRPNLSRERFFWPVVDEGTSVPPARRTWDSHRQFAHHERPVVPIDGLICRWILDVLWPWQLPGSHSPVVPPTHLGGPH